MREHDIAAGVIGQRLFRPERDGVESHLDGVTSGKTGRVHLAACRIQLARQPGDRRQRPARGDQLRLRPSLVEGRAQGKIRGAPRPPRDRGLLTVSLLCVRQRPQAFVERRFRDLETRPVAHHHYPQRSGASEIGIGLGEQMARARMVVHGNGIGRAQEAIGLERRAETQIPEFSTPARHLAGHASPAGLTGVEGEPAAVSPRQPRLRDHLDYAAETIAVLRRKTAGHYCGAIDDLRAHAGREHGVRVLPERHAVDGRIQRNLVTANVHEIVVPANHARRKRHDRIGQAVLLPHGKRFEPFG